MADIFLNLKFCSGRCAFQLGVGLPSALTHMALGVVDGRIYAVGGRQIGFIALATVEVYDTGFRGTENLQNLSSVSPQGKLTKAWGEIKRSR